MVCIHEGSEPMRRLAVAVILVGVAAALVGVLRATTADQQAPTTQRDVLREVQQDLKALKAQVEDWVAKQKALREEVDKLQTAFKRHTHAVKFWDGTKKQATGWAEGGSFFLTTPKVGEGEGDADAVKAAGTWGTP
jgi:septal ring factor EnvC (AmiA/AmiB activator)